MRAIKIFVEIGTDEQKEAIRNELACIEEALKHCPIELPEIITIVPNDFDHTINATQRTRDYKACRSHEAVAKTIRTNGGVTLVFSPRLYTNQFDGHLRLFIYFHEMFHVINMVRFGVNERSELEGATAVVLQNTYTLFDEYYANRRAFELVDGLFPVKSQMYRRRILRDAAGFVRFIIDDANYQILQAEIASFRLHGQVDTFLKKCNGLIDGLSKTIVYLYAYLDHFPRLRRFENIIKTSPFVTSRSLKAIDFLRAKYLSGDTDFKDGVQSMSNFFENFGVRFEDQGAMLYCHVLDI